MTGTSSSARSDKPGKNNKDLFLATVKDEFASSPKKNSLKIEHEILKENHEKLKMDYESLEEMTKHAEETYEVLKKQLLQNRSEGLEVTNTRLVEDCERERSEKEKYKKIFEEMKAMERERKATIDQLRTREQELLMARRKGIEEAEKIENKFVELAEKVGVIETECSFLKSLYDAEVAAAGTVTPAMSGIGETQNLIGHGGNKVNNNVKNDVTDPIMISDESDDEQDNPPRESNISTQRSVVDRRSQEEQGKNRAVSSNGNQALGETVTPRAVHFSPSSPSSSSSSYEVVVKLPANWPEWAKPKGPGDDSNKS